MAELLQVVLAGWILPSLVTGVLLAWDRRRLDAYGKARMWNFATLALVVSGMYLPSIFIPTPVCFGAHVWVTRRGRWWGRFAKALLAAAVAMAITVLVNYAVLGALGLLPDE